MAIPSYIVGSAAAETLARYGALKHPDASPFSAAQLFNAAEYALKDVGELMQTDAELARDSIITAASRLILCAQTLEPHAEVYVGKDLARAS